ncbi:NAD(P)H-binding protein, partial [Streptomyces sp. O3]
AHAGAVYELVGEAALGGAELAAAVGGSYAPSTLADAREVAAGWVERDLQVPMVVGTYSAIAGGFLDGTELGARQTLRTLLGRAPRPAAEIYAATVAGEPEH